MAKKVSVGKAVIVGAIVTGLCSVGSAVLTNVLSKSTTTVEVPEPGPTVTVTARPKPPAPPSVQLGNISDGQPVPTCFTATGNAKLSGDQTVILGAHAEGDPRWYWEGSVTWNPSNTRWSIFTNFGDVTDPHRYSMTVVAAIIDKSLADYLKSTNSKFPNDTWWSSVSTPPNVLAQDSAVVTRTGQVGECSPQ
jgi:hypothetical protein